MSASKHTGLSSERLAAYADGACDAAQCAHIEAELALDGDARERLAQVQAIRAALAAPVPEVDALDLRSHIQIALQTRASSGASARAPGLRTWLMAAVGLSVVGYLALGRSPDQASEFHARAGKPEQPTAAERWAGVRIYRALSTAELTPLLPNAVLARDDSLLFSYTNLGPAPFKQLMIFARDTRDQVYWYYPAHNDEAIDPSSLSIESRAGELLPDMVAHGFRCGPLTIYALFSRSPLHVREIERRLRDAPDALDGIADSFVQQIPLRVCP